jgi:tRNA modification GTPase
MTPLPADTVFALATPLAKSGVAVVRVSGTRAKQILAALTNKIDWTPNHAAYVTFQTPDNSIIDKGLALFFQAPRSFTGEDVVELHVHGSLGVIRELLEVLGRFPGLRPAEPGEFTRRAYSNGKMDLLGAEALADLIAAETPAQKIQALAQMQGDASRYYEQLRKQTVECLALLEAYIDFPDEDIPESVLSDVATRIHTLKITLKDTLADNHRGERLREGIRVVILGEPNVGKSSLLNALSRKEAAIVSHQAGTTRDAIEVHLNLGGFPVILVDTAGVRETKDEIEEEGVRRAITHAENADIVLVLLDAERANANTSGITRNITEKSIIVINKCDLFRHTGGSRYPELYPGFRQGDIIQISAKTGQGIDVLLKTLENRISNLFSSGLSNIITRNRHRRLLESALYNLEQFSLDKPLELACEMLRAAAQDIGRITGKIAVDDVLDVVFKSFCIGK